MDCSELATVQSASIESHNSITSVVVAAVATASTLEIELWLSVFTLVLLQVHCNPQYHTVQLPGLLRITHT